MQARMDILKDYYKSHQELDINTTDTYNYNGEIVKIGDIITYIRKQYKLYLNGEGVLNKEQVAQLEAMNFVWTKQHKQ
jgi:hypothetical protein